MGMSKRLVAVGSLLAGALLTGCGSGDNALGGIGNGTGDDGGGTIGNDGGTAHDSGGGAQGDAGGLLGDAGGNQGSDGGSGGNDSGSSHDAGGGDAATGSDAGSGPFVPAAHPPFFQLVTAGGPILTSPVVQPVFFSNYDITDQVITMMNGLPAAKLANGDAWFSGAVSEYGVGALTVLPAIKLTDVAPTTDTDPASFLAGKMSDPAFSQVTASTIVAIFYPSTTPLSGSCAAQTHGYGGYHDAFSNGGHDQPFAVMSECANYGPLVSALDMVTVAASHEIIEATIDPYPSSKPAYVGLDGTSGSGFAMSALLQGNAENGDLCAINDAFGRGDASYAFLLSRGWSNKSAAAGNLDPCAPDIRPGQPFVGAYPAMPDTVNIQGQSGPGVVIPVGQTKTVDVNLFTFEPTADYTVVARQSVDVNPPTLTFAWDKTTGHNGDTLHLTITAVSQGGQYESFVIQSYLPGTVDTQKPTWAGVVTH
jgi:hypothetical protein